MSKYTDQQPYSRRTSGIATRGASYGEATDPQVEPVPSSDIKIPLDGIAPQCVMILK